MALWTWPKGARRATGTLLGGRLPPESAGVRPLPRRGNMLDKASCANGPQKARRPGRFHRPQIRLPSYRSRHRLARDAANGAHHRELIDVQRAFENAASARLGPTSWSTPLEYDRAPPSRLPSSRADQPLWFEDPLQVEYSEEWSKLCQSAHVPICTGENLARRQGFRDFIITMAPIIGQSDRASSGAPNPGSDAG